MAYQRALDGMIPAAGDFVAVRNHGARVRTSFRTMTVTAAEGVVGQLGILKIPSNAVVLGVWTAVTSNGTAGTADIGLMQDDGTEIDYDFFASAAINFAFSAAWFDTTPNLHQSVPGTNNIGESGVYTDANASKPLWEAVGLSEKPDYDFVIGLNFTVGMDAEEVLNFRTDWILD